MKTTMMMVMAVLLAACGDQPRLTSPAEALADREAHNAYLESKYNAEHLADCEFYELEEC